MKVAYATTLTLVYWLIVASLYWPLSDYAHTHTNPKCSFGFTKHRDGKIWINWYDWHVCKNTETNNVYFCIRTKSTHYLTKNISICISSGFYHLFSQIKYQLGPSIKWWEGICFVKERSNTSVNAIKCYANVILQIFSKNQLSYVFIQRTKSMAEANSTKNMDVCVIDENEIITTFQKRTTFAVVTTIQKKTKNKKVPGLKYSSLWLGFQALNLINKQKDYQWKVGKQQGN
jgi:hypothetical protein